MGLAVSPLLFSLVMNHRFRAYHSRRYKHNYYARKAYIEAVVDKSEQLRKQLEEALHAQVDEAIAAQEQKARAEVQALSAKLHHLVSTKQAPGIYNSPMHDGFLPTAFSIPIEQHLRNAIKPQVREEMRRSSKGKLTNTKPQLSLAAAARASDPYISAEEQRRLQERASRSAFVAGDFSTATKHGGIFSETRQSIQAGSPYVDAGKQQLSRTVSKPSWVSSKVHKLCCCGCTLPAAWLLHPACASQAFRAPQLTAPCALDHLLLCACAAVSHGGALE